SGGVLTVLGDTADNNISVAADAAGNLTVTDNGQSITIQSQDGSDPTKFNLKSLYVDGGNGDDTITTSNTLNVLDANGKLAFAPDATLLGGNGNDIIAPTHGGFVGGVVGARVVGNCYMDGGNGDDILISGRGNDTMLGGNGDDNYVWPPGTLTDTWDGGAGNDTVTINGNNNNQSDAFQLSAGSNGHPLFQRTNLVPFSVDISNTETIVLNPGSGDDTVTINDLTGVTNLQSVVVNGGDGNDVINAIAQNNARVQLTLNGGNGNDVINGGAGNDQLYG